MPSPPPVPRPFLLDGPGHAAVYDSDPAALAWYASRPGRAPGPVLVELRAGVSGTVEVWLDRRPVGRLDPALSRRYAPVVMDLQRRGENPACTARVGWGRDGLGIELQLAEQPLPLSRPVPRSGRALRPLLAAAAVVAVLITLSTAVGSGDEDRVAAPARTVPAVVDQVDVTSVIAPTTTAPAESTAPDTSTLITTTPTSTATERTADDRTAADRTAATSSTATRSSATRSTSRTRASTTTATPPTATTTSPRPPESTARVTPAPDPEPTPSTSTPKPSKKVEPVPTGGCDSNYSGCVPIASDVDCKGGSGNGPAYVSGPIRVTGSDIYGLDHDKDGIACE